MERGEILDTAKSHVTKDRAATHGEMEDSFATIAALWSAYTDCNIAPHQVAVMMTLLKIARTKNNPLHDDNWVDAAGYMACGGSMFDRVGPIGKVRTEAQYDSAHAAQQRKIERGEAP